MLVVVSIIMIVAVVALPAITSLSKSASRRSSVSLVMAALDQARAQAVGQSATCYFVLANGDNRLVVTESADKPPADYRYRAFAIYQEVYIPPPAGTPPADAARPYHLLPIRQWTLLPEGVSFKPDPAPKPGDTVAEDPTIFSQPTPTTPVTFFCQWAKAELALPYLKFNSTGAIEEPTDARFARLKLFEGYVASNGAAVATNAAKSFGDETVVLSLFTGRAKRQEVHAAN
jgi:type II secretory pathway pseudopilin PulG